MVWSYAGSVLADRTYTFCLHLPATNLTSDAVDSVGFSLADGDVGRWRSGAPPTRTGASRSANVRGRARPSVSWVDILRFVVDATGTVWRMFDIHANCWTLWTLRWLIRHSR